ncbi:putative disease resistance protein RGA4 [Hordeum vulgare]|nr:putative disease resistance protein RGA4 [Hordeum vulgare]
MAKADKYATADSAMRIKVIDLGLEVINSVIEPGEVPPDVIGIDLVLVGELRDHHMEGPKCGYVEWVDPEWPPQLKTTLGRLWDMYEDENKLRLSNNLANAEGNFKVLKGKDKMEKDLRFFKLDFAKMVADKEQALAELGNTQIALSDLKEEYRRRSFQTNLPQIFMRLYVYPED